MGKIGLILDSSSNLTKKEANIKGFGFIPLIININDKEYKAGIDIKSEEILKEMSNREIKIMTSLPNGKDIYEAFDFALENNDTAIFISLSGKFSGTNNAARIISEESKYKGKIFVYDSEYSSPWSTLYVDEFKILIEEAKDYKEAFAILDKAKPYMVGYMSPGDLWWFYKGGRINKVQYLAGSLLKMKPILKVADGEIKKNEIQKARTIPKAITKMCESIEKTVNTIKEKGMNFKFVILESTNKALSLETENIVLDYFKITKEKILKIGLSPEQSAHMGPGSFGVTLIVSFKELKKKG